MTTRKSDPFPCGCVFIYDDKKTFINGVDMTSMVANVCGIERCPPCEARWNESMKEWIEKMIDAGIEEAIWKESNGEKQD